MTRLLKAGRTEMTFPAKLCHPKGFEIWPWSSFLGERYGHPLGDRVQFHQIGAAACSGGRAQKDDDAVAGPRQLLLAERALPLAGEVVGIWDRSHCARAHPPV